MNRAWRGLRQGQENRTAGVTVGRDRGRTDQPLATHRTALRVLRPTLGTVRLPVEDRGDRDRRLPQRVPTLLFSALLDEGQRREPCVVREEVTVRSQKRRTNSSLGVIIRIDIVPIGRGLPPFQERITAFVFVPT